MIYCPLIDDYVDQTECCIKTCCEHYSELTDSCGYVDGSLEDIY